MRYDDITGQTFGELTAIEYVGKGKWRWKCSCGKEVIIRTDHVRQGYSSSCGHIRRDKARESIKNNIFGYFYGSNISHIRKIVAGGRSRTNTTGYTGITAYERKNSTKYYAKICVKGKIIYLGSYDTLDDAVLARKNAEEKYYAPIIAKYDKEHEDS